MDLLVNLRLQWQQVGLNEIGAEARKALAGIQSLPAPQRAAAARDIRAGLSTEIEARRRQELADKGIDPGSRAARDLGRKYDRAQVALNTAFDQIGANSKEIGTVSRNTAKTVKDSYESTARAFASMSASTRASIEAAARAAGPTPRSRVEAELSAPHIADRGIVGEAAQNAEIRATRAAVKAEEERLLTANAQYTRDTLAAAQSRRERAAKERAADLGVSTRGLGAQEIEVQNALAERVQAYRQQARVARAEANRSTSQGQQLAAAEAEARRATRELAEVRHREAQAEIRQSIREGQGTFFQRAQAAVAYRGNQKPVEDYQKFGQFVGARALTTVGFGLAGSALYGSVRIIGDMIREAEELDRILNQVNATLIQTGADSDESFSRAKEGILDIASSTGEQADIVAGVLQQFIGAFANAADGSVNLNEALRQTEQAMQVVAVTGLSLNEVLDSLTAVAKTFGTDVDDVSDIALGLQERLGVMAKETIAFTADLAPVAKQVGLTLEETAAIGAVANQVSGRAGSALAEAYSRVLPTIQDVSTEIVNLYNLPALQGNQGKILESLAAGDTGQVFLQLVQDYDKLSKSQQNYILQTLGGRRETQALIPVLENSGLLMRQLGLDGGIAPDDGGKTREYFEELQKTVQNTQARFGEMFKQIGEALFSSGAADAFADIVNMGGQLVGMIAAVVNIIGPFTRAFDGMIPKLLLFAGVFKLLSPLMRAFTAGQQANAVASTTQATGFLNVTRTAEGMSLAVGRATAADAAESAASIISAQNNSLQAASMTRVSAAARLQAGAQRAGGLLFGRNPVGRYGTPGFNAALEQAFNPATNAYTRGLQTVGNRGGLFGGLTGTLFGGGATTIGGKGVALPGGLMGALRSAAPTFLAFEALNKFFQNVATQTEAANATAEDAKGKLDAAASGTTETGLTLDEQIQNLRDEANRLRANQENTFGSGDKQNIVARGVNFVGGLFGNENAAREAAGQDQDFEIIEQQIAAQQSEAYSEVVGLMYAQNEQKLLDLLAKTDISAFRDIFTQNSTDYTQQIIDIFKGGETDTEFDAGNIIQAGELTKENIQKVIDLALAGNEAAAEVLRLLSDFFTSDDPEIQAILDSSEFKEAANSGAGAFMARLEDVKGQFEGGVIGSGAYLNRLLEERQTLMREIEANRNAGNQENLAKNLAALAAANKEISGLTADYAKAQNSNLEFLSDLYGDGEGSNTGVGGPGVQGALLDQRIGVMTAAAQNPNVSVADKIAMMPELYKLLQEKFERELAAIEDPVARAEREKQGFQLPPAFRSLLVLSQVSVDPTLTNIVSQVATITGQNYDTLITNLSNTIASTDKTAKEVTIQLIDNQLNVLRKLLTTALLYGDTAAMATLRAQIEQLEGVRAEVERSVIANPDEGPATGGTNDGSGGGTVATKEQIAQARIARDKARANGDPVRIAELEVRAAREARAAATTDLEEIEAETRYIEAMNSLRDAREDVVAARLDLLQTQVGRDPVRAAQVAVEAAQHAVDTAKGEAARIRADAQLLDAQRELKEAQDDIVFAQIEQAEALADAAGNTVGTAAARLLSAQVKLQEVLSDPTSGEAERIRAQTEIIRAQASLRDAQFEDRLGDVDFMLEMEQIGISQAIRMLEAMLAIPGNTEEMVRELQRRIKQLRDEAKTDFKMNIPNIDLPTLYEVRRLNQTPSGSGYNDNRVVTINFTATNQVDAQSIANQIVDGFSAPSRFGTAAKAY